jgi:hypothetical protein
MSGLARSLKKAAGPHSTQFSPLGRMPTAVGYGLSACDRPHLFSNSACRIVFWLGHSSLPDAGPVIPCRYSTIRRAVAGDSDAAKSSGANQQPPLSQ